jgi:hypothetical protein
VRMVEWGLGSHAHEFLRANLDDGYAKVIMEVRNYCFAHDCTIASLPLNS